MSLMNVVQEGMLAGDWSSGAARATAARYLSMQQNVESARPPAAAAAENEPDNNLFSPEDVESERVSVLFSCRALELPVMAEALLYPAWETMLIKKNNEGNERLGRLWINARIYYRRTVGRERARRGVGVSPRGRARILFNYALQMDRGHARHPPLMTRRIVNYCQ